ncbi:MAG TPA: hypothetical protein VH063_16655 [Gaiellaceae bacterium]|nr:hypothetical protein [Gaiellaceae bacterium]
MRTFVAPWQVAAAVLIFNVGFFAPQLHREGAVSFAQIGNHFVTWHVAPASHRSPRIASLSGTRRIGYDGQFSYYMDLDPVRARYYTDDPPYRYGRILLPAAAWVLGAGQPGAFAYTLIALNLFAIVATVYLLAGYLVRRGLTPWWAGLYGVFPGIMICLWADLSEPLAFLFAAWGYLEYERRPERVARYGALFALAVLARETALVIPALVAIQIALRGREGLRLRGRAVGAAAALLAITLVPTAIWRGFLQWWLGGSPFGTPYDWVPFQGIWHYWPFGGRAVVVLLAVVLPGLVWLVLALDRLRSGRPTLPQFMVIVSVLLFVVLVPSAVEAVYESAGRTITSLVLAVILWLPDLRASPPYRPRLVDGAIWLLTPVWFLIVLALAAL